MVSLKQILLTLLAYALLGSACTFVRATEKPAAPPFSQSAEINQSSETKPATKVDHIRLTSGEWAPYLSAERPHFGLAAHIVSEAFKLEGIEVEYGFFNWNRAFDQAKAGRWNGSLVWGKKGDREEFFYFSDPVIREKAVLYHLKELNFHWTKYADLKDYTVGLTKSYHYSDQFQSAIEKGLFQVQITNKDILNFKKLLKKRIDLFPLDYVVAQDLLLNHFSIEEQQKITFHPNPVREGTQHLILSNQVPQNTNLIKRFNKGLRALKASGQYQQLWVDFEQGKYSGK